MSFAIGESVGHYEIVEELGSGGTGRVLKVQHLITRRREAMKVLVDNKPDSPEQAQRFLREIRLQASLDHPNIAAVHNAFWLEDDLVMIMELIEGQTLATLLEHRRFSLEQGLTIIRQVLQALSYAHRNGVIHRDVSPSNIVVNAQGRVKLTDFGLAKGLTDPNLTEMGGMYGSPFYVSPEQVRGAASVDHRSDIYSTAVVLYELVTGTRPFIAASGFLLMQAHVQQVPEPPIYRNSAIPQYLNAAILRAMAKNPDDRYQTSEEFLAAVDGPQAAPAISPVVARPVAATAMQATPTQATVEIPALQVGAVQPGAVQPTGTSTGASTGTSTGASAGASAGNPEFSYSYAEPQPYEPVEFESVTGKPWSTPVAKPAEKAKAPVKPRNPMVGALIGLGVVLIIVLPMVFLNWRSSQSRTVAKPAGNEPLAIERAAETGATAGTGATGGTGATAVVPAGTVAPTLVSGPREVPVPGTRVATGSRVANPRAATKTVVAPAAPVIKIWGAASAPVATASAPPPIPPKPVAPPPVAPKPMAPKLEEPPMLAQPGATASVPTMANPTLEPLPQGPAKRSFFRRLAKGVRSLNPVKAREGASGAAGAPATSSGQTSGSGNRP
jgi:serine/threonine-protein kinase